MRADSALRSAPNKKGGGICVYLKEEYDAEVINFANFEQCNIELLCFKFSGKNKGSVTCATIYSPPKGEVESTLICLDNLTRYLGDITREKVVIHGDFNINLNNRQCKWVKSPTRSNVQEG